jgi:hypothetical protein
VKGCDYDKAREEFQNNSLLRTTTPVPLVETTTELPGDEWTTKVEMGQVVESRTLETIGPTAFVTPQVIFWIIV